MLNSVNVKTWNETRDAWKDYEIDGISLDKRMIQLLQHVNSIMWNSNAYELL